MLSEAGEMKLRPWFWVRRLCVTTCISGLLFAAPMQAQDKPLQDRQTQDNQEKLDVDDVSRSFIVHLPKGYD